MESELYITNTLSHVFPELSEWSCYLFGNVPGGEGIVYIPKKGQVPNAFIRWMTKVCFACTWIRNKEENK